MAQFRKDTHRYLQDSKTLFEVFMQADEYGNIQGGSASGPTKYSSFGEPISVPIEPIIQLDALYGLDPREFQRFYGTSGSNLVTSTLFKCRTGTDPYGYGVIRSNRILRYRPGQGALLRFTAGFTNPQTNVSLRAGFFTQESALQVGYDGENFGIMRQNGGRAHIARLTVSAGGTGTTTITLNGVATEVSISSSDTAIVAATIGAASFTGWQTEVVDSTVIFLSSTLGEKSGSFSMSGTGTGTFATLQAGVANNVEWTYQADFNVDKLDGTGPSGVTIDPSKLNIFQINFRWLGAGEIRFAMENPLNGDMIFFHHVHYSNQNIDVHINNPSFRVGYVAANLSGSSLSTESEIYGASMMAAIEGVTRETAFPTAVSSDYKTSLTNGNYHSIISIKNSLVHRDKINLRLVVLKKLSISTTTNGPTRIYLFLNGTKSTQRAWNRVADYSSVLQDISTGSFTLTNEHPMAVYTLPDNGSSMFELDDLKITIPPSNWLDIAIIGSQTIQNAVASLTWIEI